MRADSCLGNYEARSVSHDEQTLDWNFIPIEAVTSSTIVPSYIGSLESVVSSSRIWRYSAPMPVHRSLLPFISHGTKRPTIQTYSRPM